MRKLLAIACLGLSACAAPAYYPSPMTLGPAYGFDPLPVAAAGTYGYGGSPSFQGGIGCSSYNPCYINHAVTGMTTEYLDNQSYRAAAAQEDFNRNFNAELDEENRETDADMRAMDIEDSIDSAAMLNSADQ